MSAIVAVAEACVRDAGRGGDGREPGWEPRWAQGGRSTAQGPHRCGLPGNGITGHLQCPCGVSRVSRPWRWFLGFLVAHALLAALLVVPGYFAIDEVIYHWMALEVPHTGGLEVRTDYREYPSPEYAHNFLQVHDGRTVPQYPYLFPLLAAPLVRVFGLTGLILLNFVAFPVLLWLTWRLARTLFAGERIAWMACGLLVLGGYAWEYSLAVWPQMVSMALGVAGLLCGVQAMGARDPRARSRSAFLAGLLVGLNLGVRIDTVTLPAALLLAFAFARPWRPREILALVLGCLPGLMVLAATNQVKFGTMSPFSYGTQSGTKLSVQSPLVGLGVVVALTIAWLLTRGRFWPWTCRHRWVLAGAAVLMSAALLGVPAARGVVLRLVDNGWNKFIDATAFDRSMAGAALRRTPDGGMVYLESLKQGWLQGMPWLAMLVAPLLALGSRGVRHRLAGAPSAGAPGLMAGAGVQQMDHGTVRRGRDGSDAEREGTPAAAEARLPSPEAAIALLFLPVLTMGGMMALVRFHGGLSLNQRYLLPLLPFVSLLGAWTLDGLALAGVRRPKPALIGGLAVLTSSALWLLVERVVPRADQQGFVLMRWPLILAAVIALGTLTVLIPEGRSWPPRATRRAAALILGPALVVAVSWAFAMSFLYDLPRHRLQRISNLEVARVVKPLVPPGSAFFSAPYLDPFYALIEVPQVRVLFPSRDKFRDFPAIVDFHLQAGRPVYGVFRLSEWRRLLEGPLAGKASTPVYTFEERFERGPVLRPRGPGLVPPFDPQLTFILAKLETAK